MILRVELFSGEMATLQKNETHPNYISQVYHTENLTASNCWQMYLANLLTCVLSRVCTKQKTTSLLTQLIPASGDEKQKHLHYQHGPASHHLLGGSQICGIFA
jgi:hypothetical protein